MPKMHQTVVFASVVSVLTSTKPLCVRYHSRQDRSPLFRNAKEKWWLQVPFAMQLPSAKAFLRFNFSFFLLG